MHPHHILNSERLITNNRLGGGWVEDGPYPPPMLSQVWGLLLVIPPSRMFGSATVLKSQVLNKKLHLKDNSFRKWYSSSLNFRAKVRHLLISSHGSVLMREQHERMYGPFVLATQGLDRKYECGERLARPQK